MTSPIAAVTRPATLALSLPSKASTPAATRPRARIATKMPAVFFDPPSAEFAVLLLPPMPLSATDSLPALNVTHATNGAISPSSAGTNGPNFATGEAVDVACDAPTPVAVAAPVCPTPGANDRPYGADV